MDQEMKEAKKDVSLTIMLRDDDQNNEYVPISFMLVDDFPTK